VSTASAVTGSFSKRTPVASYSALSTAGMVGMIAPSPTSLAPKGPLGSSLSTTMAPTGGMSSAVGIL